RPSEKWGVAHADLQRELDENSALALVNPARDAYVTVTVDDLHGRSLEAYRNEVIELHRGREAAKDGDLQRVTEFKLRANGQLPTANGVEAGEVLLDLRQAGQRLTFLIRVVRPVGSRRVFLLRGWTMRRRFAQAEPEIRRLLDSFEVIGGR